MLAELLKTRPVLLADGATGTNLFEMGLTSGDAPEQWLELHPDRIKLLHQQFVDAGADIILTNSFGCNARRLMLHNMQDRTRELNRIAASLAREVADKSDRKVVVAGSVGPTGDLFVPLGILTEEDAVAHVGMPFVITASIDTAGRTMMGITPAALAEFYGDINPKPLAGGANCGVGASDTLAAILTMTETRPNQIIIAKGNAGMPTLHGTHVHYSGTPETMAEYVRLAIDAGARIIGGCCGTSPAHLAAMRKAIDTHVRGPRPTLDEIAARTGAFAAPPVKPPSQPRETNRRRS
jgi:methionine synthase I (cobalamin-dependent)